MAAGGWPSPARQGKALGAALLGAALLLGLRAEAAEAILGKAVTEFTHSPLLSDACFRFEGRSGARYRFGPARMARFGPGLLALDVADGFVVQELLVLPLPLNRHMSRENLRVQKLFLSQGGFPSKDMALAEATIQAALDRGLPQEAALGGRHRILVRVDLALKSYLTALQLASPSGMALPNPQASPEPGASQ